MKTNKNSNMKNHRIPSLLIPLILFTGFINSISAQVGFNNPNPDPSSLIDLTAYDKGLLIPRMTSAQRIAISSPANGLLVFDKDLNVFCEYDTVSNPDKWVMINPWKGSATNNSNISLVTTGNVGIGVPVPTHRLDVKGNIKSSDTVIAEKATLSSLTTTGNIGVGVPTPVHKLDVKGNIRSTDSIIAKTATLTTLITTGNVGIGVAIPSEKLEVNGNIKSSDTLIATTATLTSLTTTGNVGIGVTIPVHKLDVSGNIKSTDTIIAQTATLVSLLTTGNVGIGVTTPAHKLDVDGNIRTTDTIIARTATFTGNITAASFSGDGAMPSGAIIMWYGTTPPTGWKICDGTNSTPDLRGRFIVGAGTNSNPAPGDINPSYSVGTVGGENLHTLTKAQIPKHTHASTGDGATVNITSSGGHIHNVPIGAGTDFIRNVPTCGGPGLDSQTMIVGGTHTHANSNFSGIVGDGTSDGLNTQSHENRPPYYVLMYIMKQ